jgi:hypothetical protein
MRYRLALELFFMPFQPIPYNEGRRAASLIFNIQKSEICPKKSLDEPTKKLVG